MKMSYRNTCFCAYDEYMKWFSSIWFGLVFFPESHIHKAPECLPPLGLVWSRAHTQKPSVWFFIFHFVFPKEKLILIFLLLVCWIGLLLMLLFDVGTFPLIHLALSPHFTASLIRIGFNTRIRNKNRTEQSEAHMRRMTMKLIFHTTFFPLIFSRPCCPLLFFTIRSMFRHTKEICDATKTRKTRFHYT